jgi:hypothetical protein
MNAPALRTTFAGLTRALTPVPVADTLGDAWRTNLSAIREDIRFISIYRRVLAEKDERLSSGHRLHRPAYVKQCRRDLVATCRSYLARVRRITEAEAQMTAMGIRFAQSSDAWSEAELSDAMAVVKRRAA